MGPKAYDLWYRTWRISFIYLSILPRLFTHQCIYPYMCLPSPRSSKMSTLSVGTSIRPSIRHPPHLRSHLLIFISSSFHHLILISSSSSTPNSKWRYRSWSLQGFNDVNQWLSSSSFHCIKQVWSTNRCVHSTFFRLLTWTDGQTNRHTFLKRCNSTFLQCL